MAAKVDFDGANTLIIVKSGITTLDVEIDLYSDWKEYVQANDNAKFLQAFRSTAGDPIGGGKNIGAYFFLQNDKGWRIRPQESNHVLQVNGNIFGEDTNAAIYTSTLGAFNVLINQEVSTQALQVETGISGLTVTESTTLTSANAHAFQANAVVQQANVAAQAANAAANVAQIILQHKSITDPVTGIMTIFDTDGTTVLFTANVFEDASGTQIYRGQGIERREKLI